MLVRLVDFGSTHIVSFDKLGRLTKSLAEIPMLAIHCHFPLVRNISVIFLYVLVLLLF